MEGSYEWTAKIFTNGENEIDEFTGTVILKDNPCVPALTIAGAKDDTVITLKAKLGVVFTNLITEVSNGDCYFEVSDLTFTSDALDAE